MDDLIALAARCKNHAMTDDDHEYIQRNGGQLLFNHLMDLHDELAKLDSEGNSIPA